MKKNIYFLVMSMLAFLVSCTTEPDNDDGDDWDAAKVCPETGTNAYGMSNRGQFTDERDGQVYKYTTIGKQVWMAENLRYNASYSECYDVLGDSCKTFGRYYLFVEGGKLTFEFQKINESLFDSVCPEGWHVPSNDEWTDLINIMGKNAAIKLKGNRFWGGYNDLGTNECDFDALPTGYMGYTEAISIFNMATFVSSSLETENFHNIVGIGDSVTFSHSDVKNSVRCVKD